MTTPDRPLVAWIAGIGLRGPGLDGWAASVDVLADVASPAVAPTAIVAPVQLPPAERRRVGKGVKIALEAGFAAIAHAGRDASTLPSVFTSSSGDGDNCDAICRALADDRLISPTRFHNSVHNAPSGYWGIASRSMEPSTSLCAYDDSFMAGLDDALTQLAGGLDAILLVAYDAPYPEPLHAARPTPDSFAVGLVLTRDPGPHALARIALRGPDDEAASTMRDPTLEHLRRHIPAARALPLLAAIARDADASVVFVDARGVRTGIALHPHRSPETASLESRTSCA